MARHGFTLHAASGLEKLTITLVRLEPWMCNKVTYIWRNPGDWSPLMMMAEAVRSPTGSAKHTSFNLMFNTILSHTDFSTLMIKTSSGATVLHQLVARKHEEAMFMVCHANEILVSSPLLSSLPPVLYFYLALSLCKSLS